MSVLKLTRDGRESQGLVLVAPLRPRLKGSGRSLRGAAVSCAVYDYDLDVFMFSVFVSCVRTRVARFFPGLSYRTSRVNCATSSTSRAGIHPHRQYLNYSCDPTKNVLVMLCLLYDMVHEAQQQTAERSRCIASGASTPPSVACTTYIHIHTHSPGCTSKYLILRVCM